jgi:hypothetical protein
MLLFKALQLYFFKLTMRNWGAPYHFILSAIGTDLTMLFLPRAAAVAAIFGIALLYEYMQLKTAAQMRASALNDMLEDIIFDCAGIIYAILT